MFNNIQENAALSIQVLSSLWLQNPNPIYERISNFMPRLTIIAIIIFLSSFSQVFAQSCNYSDISDGLSCESSVYLCNSIIDGYSGTLPVSNPIPQSPFLCDNSGSIENPLWFTFLACDAEMELKINISNCTVDPVSSFTGMQAAIYSECGASTAVVCATDAQTSEITLTSNTFIPGNIYYLIIDGYGGSVCNFNFEVISGFSDNTYNLSVDGDNKISGPGDQVCIQKDQILGFEIPECELTSSGTCTIPSLWGNELLCYDWTITPDTYVFIGSPDNAFMEVVFQEEGIYEISVTRNIHPYIETCSTGACDDPEPITIEVNFIDTVYNSTFLCPGEFIDICGDLINSPGVYECYDESECVISFDTVDVGNGIEAENLGIIFLCPGECFSLEGIDYCDRDNYNILSSADCNKSYQFSIQDLSFNITPQAYGKINCSGDPIQVIHDVSTNYEGDIAFKYLDSEGNEISSTVVAEIDEIGDYLFVVYSPEFGIACSDTLEFSIEEDAQKPVFTLQTESLTCTDKEAQIEIETTDNLVSYSWIGPSAGSVIGNNVPVVQGIVPGTYSVTVTGINGCTEVASIEVLTDYPPVDIEIDWEDLDCNIAQSTLSYFIDIAVDSILWTGPEEFRASVENPTITNEGTYVLNIFASSGCDYSEIFKVLGNYETPEIQKNSVQVWSCQTESVQLSVDYSDTSDYSLNWFTDSGIIQGGNTQKEVSVELPGMYFIETTNNITGCSKIDTLIVEISDDVPSELNLDKIDPLCHDINDGIIEILEVVGGTAPYDYFVNGEIQNEMILEGLSPDSYEIVAIDANGCEVQRIIDIESPTQLKAGINGPKEGIYEEFISFEAIIADSFNIAEINWYNETSEYIGSGETVTFQLLKNELITMEVIDENGCIVLRTAPVLLDEDYDYFVPNIFTPNGDGINDYFNIFPQDLPGTIQEFGVFDRWGNKVFEITDVDNFDNTNWGWDGRDKGVLVKQGVYVYYAKVETLGVEKELKGTITLMR